MNFRADQFSIKPSEKGFVDAWVPRALIADGKDVLGNFVSKEGLTPLRLSWINGRVNSIQPIDQACLFPSKIVLPRFVEPHSHIDKAYTWNDFPNLFGTYDFAMEANLREHNVREVTGLRLRAEKVLTTALKNGIRSIRSHIDIFGTEMTQYWDLLNELKLKWKSLIDLQYVALGPLEYWNTREGEQLAVRVASQGGLVGGVIAPPFKGQKSFESVENLVKLANRLGCGIDVHIDEAEECPAAGLRILIKVLKKVHSSIPITCSHLSSLSMLSSGKLKELADLLAFYKIKVVALPLTNSWLLGRSGRATKLHRPCGPFHQLQRAGVVVAVGADNVNDSWFPIGRFDPIQLMAFSMPLVHLSPWERLGLSPFTTSAANLLDLEWDGTIKNGSPADWILFEATSWVELLSTSPNKQVLINGGLLDDSINTNRE